MTSKIPHHLHDPGRGHMREKIIELYKKNRTPDQIRSIIGCRRNYIYSIIQKHKAETGD